MQLPENKHQQNNEPVNLGEFIREARLSKGISLRRLAARMAINQSYLSRLEAGHYKHPSLEVLQRIAGVLEIDYQDLFALCGYTIPGGLPSFVPYLRARYPKVDDQTVRQVKEYFDFLRRHRRTPGHSAERDSSGDQSSPDLLN